MNSAIGAVEDRYAHPPKASLTQGDPAPSNGCDPQTLFTGGTFDRIQRQVFNQNCALSGCHDSQSQAGDLLLETGAAPQGKNGGGPGESNPPTAPFSTIHRF